MFPGQGAQSVGMAGSLCEELPEAKNLFTKVGLVPSYTHLRGNYTQIGD